MAGNPKFYKFMFLYTFLVMVLAFLVLWWLFHHHKPADVVADFGGRTSTVSVPPNFFGSGGVGSTVSSQSGIDNLTKVNLRGNRIWINVQTIFANGDTPNYSAWDGQLSRGTQNGLSPMITIYGTPPSLGPQPCSMPSNLTKWAQLAAQAVKHTDQLHPGLNYELWNEPDVANGSFCPPSDPLGNYLKLYGALGPEFRKAAPTAKLGGPTLASSANIASWIPPLLSGATAPYVDFVSWHVYITGTWLLPGMTWDQAYQTTQNPTGGIAYYYRQLEQTVRKGSQPNAATTPIIVSEYNTNYAYQPNNVQNDTVYGPLWNTVAIADFLDVVAQGSLPPGRIVYFMSADSRGYFCLEGIQGGDPLMCNPPKDGQPYNAAYVPYPSLMAFQLFCASDYLNLEETGFNVVVPPTAPSGLLTITFYNPTADTLVLINPTATAVSGLRVKFSHLGIKPTHSQLFTLGNNSLTKQDLRAAPADEAMVKADVPAYSTVAIQLAQ
jgi:hypothetical protein